MFEEKKNIVWFFLAFWKFPFNHFEMYMRIKLYSDGCRNQEIRSLYPTWFMLWSVQFIPIRWFVYIFSIYLLFWLTSQSRLRFNIKMSSLFLTVISRVQYSNRDGNSSPCQECGMKGKKHLCPWTKIGLYTLEFTLQCFTETMQWASHHCWLQFRSPIKLRIL